MKIVVAGCNGRVGKRVVKLALEKGFTVIGTDLNQLESTAEHPWFNHSSCSFKQADLRDFDAILPILAGCDAVVNLAAYPNPVDYKVMVHNANVVISWNILRACAELGIKRVAQASSVNVVTLTYSQGQRLYYFPLDELHPCEPDEPYGLSKLICEMQADTIVRRYENMKVASLRLHWSVPDRSMASPKDAAVKRATDLWGYVQEDSGANAFLLAIADNNRWSGHERFFITSPHTALEEETLHLIKKFYPEVPIKEGKSINR